MRFFTVRDTTTGTIYNALASDVAGAQRLQAMQTANGLAGRRGTVIEGDRFEVEGVRFDVALHMEALQGSQPSRTERQATARVSGPVNYEHHDGWQRDGRGNWINDSRGR